MTPLEQATVMLSPLFVLLAVAAWVVFVDSRRRWGGRGDDYLSRHSRNGQGRKYPLNPPRPFLPTRQWRAHLADSLPLGGAGVSDDG